MQLLYAADPAVWDGTLGTRIRHELDAGWLVVTRTVSGAAMTIGNVATGDGTVEPVAVRHNPTDPLDTDGLPLALGRLEATSCGLWAPTGYRSSRLVTVHVLDGPAEAADTQGPWETHLLALAATGPDPQAWLRQVPSGHPGGACPGNHCALRLRDAPVRAR